MRKPQHLLDKGQGCARLLISKGAKVNARDRHHMTPLLYACQTGQVGLAELLVQSSADVNAKDVKGWTVSCGEGGGGREGSYEGEGGKL